MNGRTLTRAVSMLLPEPWDKNAALSAKRSAWDEYQSMLTESWEGPAAIAFSDGSVLGAVVDRNGLRPARYCITSDDRLILSSEAGALDLDPASILVSGILGPGQMLLADPATGRVLFDDEIKDALANEQPYRSWIDAETLTLDDLLEGATPDAQAPCDEDVALWERQAVHGLFFDDIEEAIIPMAEKGAMPLASMGDDAPLACPLVAAPALLRLLQPAVRPGDEPAHRRLARILHHLHPSVFGQPRKPAGGRARQLPAGEAGYAASDRRHLQRPGNP